MIVDEADAIQPIPLELLVIVTPDDHYNSTKLSSGRGRLITRPTAGNKVGSGTHVPPKPESKHGFSITVNHLGKKGYSMQLWVDTYVSRKKWLESIDKQQGILRERSCVFVTESITEGYFSGLRKINCISPYGMSLLPLTDTSGLISCVDNGNRMIYGTDEGVYFSNLRDDKLREPVKVINLLDVTQVDVIEEFQLLIVLHERSVTTFPLDCLDPNDANAALKRGKRISSHTSFFKSGICLGKMLVAVVKSSTLSSTIKVLEPVDLTMRGKKPQGSFMRRLNVKDDALKLFKVSPRRDIHGQAKRSRNFTSQPNLPLCIFSRPSSVLVALKGLRLSILKPWICKDYSILLIRRWTLCSSGIMYGRLRYIGSRRTFCCAMMVSGFVPTMRPTDMIEFAFYINKNGWRARPKWAIIWEGVPSAFGPSLCFPKLDTRLTRQSPPVSLRRRFRANLRGSSPRRNRSPRSNHPRQQHLLLIRRYTSITRQCPNSPTTSQYDVSP